MNLSWNDFGLFYTEANLLIHPGEPSRHLYPWQEVLGQGIGERSGLFPDAIIAPTGAGKSTGVYAHVFRAALDPSAPSRLVHVTPRRSLVDQMYEEMEALSEVLKGENLSPILQEVRDRLMARRLTLVDGSENSSVSPIVAVSRRGGMYGKRDREWLLDPSACTVMTMTAHQAISALLFKGYGTSLTSRSIEAGMLAVGTTMIFDEAHTVRQAVKTARSVSRIMSHSELDVLPLEVVEMTATPTDDIMELPNTVTVTENDYMNPSLRIGRVLSSPKPVTVLHEKEAAKPLDKWAKGIKGTVSKIVASEARVLHDTVGRGAGGRTVGVVVNTVAEAGTIADGLRESGLTVVVITGRMRSADRDLLTGRFGDVEGAYPGVLSSRGNSDVDVLVATQTIEIGVDINLAGMVTVVSSADSLAQRFGRVNRGGETTPAPITVVVPDTAETKGNGIYSGEEVSAAVAWLESLEDGNASTLAVSRSCPPVKSPRRTVVESLTYADAVNLSLVSGTRSFADEDVDLWLSDDVVRRPECNVVIRQFSDGLDYLDRKALLEALPPESSEMWVMSPSKCVRLLESLVPKENNEKLKWASSLKAVTIIPPGNSRTVDVVNEGDTGFATTGEKGSKEKLTLRDVIYGTVVLWADGPLPINAEAEYDEGNTSTWVPVENLRRNPYKDDGLRVHLLLGADVPDTTSVHTQPQRWKLITDKVGQQDSFVILPDDADDISAKWAVVVPWSGAEEHRMSVFTSSSSPVLLDAHQTDVANTASKIATLCGLDEGLVEALYLAGLHHDDGKADDRFQSMLQNGSESDLVLAKSSGRRYRVDYREYGMPQGWRHEQLSACVAYGARYTHDYRDLITALAGMSHGNGRSFFPHGITSLVPALPDGAKDVFTDGTWEELVHSLTRRFGPWQLAWLEALLRAADQTVSAQGH